MAKAYSDDLRQRCVDAFMGGETASKIATRFGVAKSSVIKWHHRYRKTGCVSPSKMGGYRSPFHLKMMIIFRWAGYMMGKSVLE